MEMEKQDGQEFEQFKALLEKHFLKKDEGEITDALIKSFRTEFDSLGLSKEDIFLYLVLYFGEVFWTAKLKTTSKPLHNNRDYALEIFAKVFSDKIDGLKEPVELEESKVRKVDMIMFLTGIEDGPCVHSPISDELALIARSDKTVLINGETGTGKELHAKAIHYLSSRSKHKFVAFNCAGIPDTLLESTLFGHEKGAFTGAVRPRVGLLEEAVNGTLFLDEIGDMPMSLQPKLLRVLQSGEYYRLGSPKKMRFSGRVIAATNKDLRAAIDATPPTFRADLYYRLNVLSIKLPAFRTLPLDEREWAIFEKLRHVMYSESIKPGDCMEMIWLSLHPGNMRYKLDRDGRLVRHPIESFAGENPYFANDALIRLLCYPFPGNYRELDNIIRRAYILSEGKRIGADNLGDEVIESWEKRIQGTGEQATADVEASGGMSGTKSFRDIIDYADKVKANLMRQKIEEIYRRGQNLKEALLVEGISSESGYQTFRNKIARVIGKGEMKHIINTYKKKKKTSEN